MTGLEPRQRRAICSMLRVFLPILLHISTGHHKDEIIRLFRAEGMSWRKVTEKLEPQYSTTSDFLNKVGHHVTFTHWQNPNSKRTPKAQPPPFPVLDLSPI
ncbi:hypothetical protein CLCR_06468 [Cladophialophora carrionii]|uniref:Uncharacterized protein n=1 Tax=Cladophialophora carrionii TaxID=86049 RepID=A0A1C1C7L1_9EURO|nr:hypothetical protein CLCR_06468 [Cladophialophora carrionii]